MSKVIACPLWRDFRQHLADERYILWLRDCCRCGRVVTVMGATQRQVERGADVVCDECHQPATVSTEARTPLII